MRRILQVIWWLLTASLFAWGYYLYEVNDPVMHHHVDELILYILWVATFPIGLIVSAVLALPLHAVEAAGYASPWQSAPWKGLTVALISGSGFWQWFWVAPRHVGSVRAALGTFMGMLVARTRGL